MSDNVWVNAAVGIAVMFAVAIIFLPGALFIGGGVAGYLEGKDGGTGVVSGSLVGLLQVVPMLLTFVLLLLFENFITGSFPILGPIVSLILLPLKTNPAIVLILTVSGVMPLTTITAGSGVIGSVIHKKNIL
jgi:hypothetical protein